MHYHQLFVWCFLPFPSTISVVYVLPTPTQFLMFWIPSSVICMLHAYPWEIYLIHMLVIFYLCMVGEGCMGLTIPSTVEPRYNEVLGTIKLTVLYQVSDIRGENTRNVKSWDQQNYLVIRGFCYIRPLYNKVPLYSIGHTPISHTPLHYPCISLRHQETYHEHFMNSFLLYWVKRHFA